MFRNWQREIQDIRTVPVFSSPRITVVSYDSYSKKGTFYPSFTQQLLRILRIDSIILIHWIVLIFLQFYLVPFHMMSPVLQRNWTYPSPVYKEYGLKLRSS